jgi:hypothetical protein
MSRFVTARTLPLALAAVALSLAGNAVRAQPVTPPEHAGAPGLSSVSPVVPLIVRI